MTTATHTTPTITRAADTPTTPRKLFVNLPVTDLQRSINFFEALGFDFNPYFTDETATCMLVGTDAYVMLLTRPKFASFSERPLGDAQRETNAIFALTVTTRRGVDAFVEKAIEAGGSAAGEAKDYGFMYLRAFHDLDGHHWEVFWMDPAAPGV